MDELAPVAGMDWAALGLSLGLLVLALALLLAEIFIVSFGALLLASLASAGGAIYYAFVASDIAGWIMTLLAPVLGVLLARWGIDRIRQSRHLVVHKEITAEAGYHHRLDALGIAPGSEGVMVTAARPSGRARFANGDCDVQARSGSLEKGDAVTVRSIDGPMVFVMRGPVRDETGVAPDSAAGRPGKDPGEGPEARNRAARGLDRSQSK